ERMYRPARPHLAQARAGGTAPRRRTGGGPPVTASSANAAALETVLARFEEAWHGGSAAPALESFAGELEPAGLVELIKLDLEYRWRGKVASGLPLVVEDYLRRFPALGAPLPEELIQEEYRARHRWGDRPAHGEYASRFPAHGLRLTQALRAVDDELATEYA